LGLGVDGALEIRHDVALLFELFHRFHQLHLTFDDEHVDDPHIFDTAVLFEFLSQLFAALDFGFWQIIFRY